MSRTSAAAVEIARDLIEGYADESPRADHEPFSDAFVEYVLRAVHASGIVAPIEGWMRAVRGTGGRKRTITVEQLFAGVMLAALDGRGLLFWRATKALYRRLSPAMRTRLGITKNPETRKEWKAAYKVVRTMFWDIVAVMNPSEYPKNRVLKKLELERRRIFMTKAESEEMLRRLDWVCNQLLEASIAVLNRETKRRLLRLWRGSLGLDATMINTNAQGTGKKSEWASSDPDAAWGIREGDHMDPDLELEIDFDALINALPDVSEGSKGRRDRKRNPVKGKAGKRKVTKVTFGYDVHYAIMGPDRPTKDRYFPRLVLGMALDRPGCNPGKNAMRVLGSIRGRGHAPGRLGVDRLYIPGCAPENLQDLARELGYVPVFDYRKDQLGIMDWADGAILVEGIWYCPAMPKNLINATIHYRLGDEKGVKISLETYRKRIEARRQYRMRLHDIGTDGQRVFRCPAELGKKVPPKVSCGRKPKSLGRPGLTVVDTRHLPKEMPKCCSQVSITIHPSSEERKYRQDDDPDLDYGSDQTSSTACTPRCATG